MSWSELPTWFHTIAEDVCTEKELDVLHKLAAGMSIRQIALEQNLHRTTIQARHANARRKITNHPDYRKATA